MSVITGIEFDLKQRSYKTINLTEIDFDELRNDGGQSGKIYWVHCDLHQQDEFQAIAEKIKLPENVIQLCHQNGAMPKIFDNNGSLTLQVQCLLSHVAGKQHAIRFSNLIIHLTPYYCFTASYEKIPALSDLSQNYSLAMQYAETPCFILFLLLDNIINDYSSILYSFELIAEKIDFIVHASHKHSFNTVMHYRKQLMKIKRHTISLRDILMRISGRKIAVISEKCRLSLSGLFDHSLMIVGQVDTVRDLLNSVLEQIDNALMFKMSESMKVLTAFAAILLPMSLIAGIYGMNFHWIPELQWKYGYFYSLSLMGLVAIILFCVFKIKNWL